MIHSCLVQGSRLPMNNYNPRSLIWGALVAAYARGMPAGSGLTSPWVVLLHAWQHATAWMISAGLFGAEWSLVGLAACCCSTRAASTPLCPVRLKVWLVKDYKAHQWHCLRLLCVWLLASFLVSFHFDPPCYCLTHTDCVERMKKKTHNGFVTYEFKPMSGQDKFRKCKHNERV